MMIAARNAFLMSGAKLPYDAEIEYLESTGTQYIDTGVNADNLLNYEFCGSATTNSIQRMGAIKISTMTRHHISLPESGTSLTVYGFGSVVSGSKGMYDNSTHVLSLINGIARLDGEQVQTFSTSPFDTGVNWFIFARNSDQGVTQSSMRLYWLKIYYSGTLVRDYIPVRVGQTGYMYDRVSGELFGNAGTGAFVIGPDK